MSQNSEFEFFIAAALLPSFDLIMVGVGEFKYVAEGFLVPAISLFGLLGNLLTVIVLRDHREVSHGEKNLAVTCSCAGCPQEMEEK